MIDTIQIKFNEAVWHDQPYPHPQLGIQAAKDFFHRERETAQLESVLKARSRKPAIIVGERRAGKTSLLRLLADHLGHDPSGEFMPIFIPWQGIQSRDALAEEMLYGILARVARDLPADARPTLDLRTPATTAEFIDLVRRLLALAAGKTVVICIDEIDSIIEEAPPTERERILGLLGPLVETADLPVGLLMTMTHTPDSLAGSRPSPLMAKAEKVRLRPFTRQEFDQMVQELLGLQVVLSPQEAQRLFELAGGWPYFGKLFLVALAEVAPGERRLERTIAAAITHPGIDDTLRNIYLKHFDDNEKALVLLLAQGKGHVSAEKMQAAGMPFQTAAATLAERDFVTAHADGSYSFKIEFLAEWFPSWPKFTSEVERRLGWLEDPWANSEPTIVTDNDLSHFHR